MVNEGPIGAITTLSDDERILKNSTNKWTGILVFGD